MEILLINFSIEGIDEAGYRRLCDEVAPAFLENIRSEISRRETSWSELTTLPTTQSGPPRTISA